MDTRRKLLSALLLVALGGAVGILARPWIVARLRTAAPLTAAQWDEQVRSDAESLVSVISRDAPPELSRAPEFRSAWDVRRAKYPPDRLADLRGRLNGYLDFLVAEYADCAEIYRIGAAARPGQLSDGAADARKRLRASYGDFAALLEKQADDLREDAYKASPRTAGFSEDLPDFRQEYDDLRAWLPGARTLVDELTQPAH